jgi:hypothetical protein
MSDDGDAAETSFVYDDVTGEGVACSVCGEQEDEEGNDMLLCEGHGCSAGYHLRCLKPALEAVPEHAWFCPTCAVSGQSHFADRILSHSGDGTRRQYKVLWRAGDTTTEPRRNLVGTAALAPHQGAGLPRGRPTASCRAAAAPWIRSAGRPPTCPHTERHTHTPNVAGFAHPLGSPPFLTLLFYFFLQ